MQWKWSLTHDIILISYRAAQSLKMVYTDVHVCVGGHLNNFLLYGKLMCEFDVVRCTYEDFSNLCHASSVFKQ